jgi:uncharacterized RDD family membrane protein YckC
MESASTCPKCGKRRESAWNECPFCGVIYSKVGARHQGMHEEMREVGGASVAAAPWGAPAPAGAAGWSPPPPPSFGGADLYRPPSAPVGEAERLRHLAGTDLAERGTRLGAVVLDNLIVGAVVAIALAPSFLFASEVAATATIVLLCLGVAGLLAANLILLYRHGQTIGKKMLGIRIVRLDGDRAGLLRILVLRMFFPGLVAAIPYLGVVFAFVDPLFIFRDDRRCLHDHMADTKVVVA